MLGRGRGRELVRGRARRGVPSTWAPADRDAAEGRVLGHRLWSSGVGGRAALFRARAASPRRSRGRPGRGRARRYEQARAAIRGGRFGPGPGGPPKVAGQPCHRAGRDDPGRTRAGRRAGPARPGRWARMPEGRARFSGAEGGALATREAPGTSGWIWPRPSAGSGKSADFRARVAGGPRASSRERQAGGLVPARGQVLRHGWCATPGRPSAGPPTSGAPSYCLADAPPARCGWKFLPSAPAWGESAAGDPARAGGPRCLERGVASLVPPSPDDRNRGGDGQTAELMSVIRPGPCSPSARRVAGAGAEPPAPAHRAGPAARSPSGSGIQTALPR